MEYTPFGEFWVEEASEVDISHITRFFTNQQYDKESGLYYMNARYYDPHLGSFITPDPAMSGLNHYAYCSANPIRYTDPTGLDVFDDEDASLGAAMTACAAAAAAEEAAQAIINDEQYNNYVAALDAAEKEIDIANGNNAISENSFNLDYLKDNPNPSGVIWYGDQDLSPEEVAKKDLESALYYNSAELLENFFNTWGALVINSIINVVGVFLDKYGISQEFGVKSTYYGKAGDKHFGIDVKTLIGTLFPAFGLGKVIEIETNIKGFDRNNPKGNFIKTIDEFGNIRTYQHLSEVFVKVGDIIERGQIIGKTGDSGYCFGAHLHVDFYNPAFKGQPDIVTMMWGINNDIPVYYKNPK